MARLAARALPPPAALPSERPQFERPARVAFAISVLLLLVQSWPLSLFFAPVFVVACRYHELAHYREVRCSRWAFLMILGPAVVCGLWIATQPIGTLDCTLGLALIFASIGLAAHLFVAQRDRAEGVHKRLLQGVDEDAPLWACGGLLALLPVLFLFAFVSGITSWRSPGVLLWGLAALALLSLQLRRHPRFPQLTSCWLAFGLGIELHAALTAGSDNGDDALVACSAVAALNGSLALYLLFAPRVRRTFVADALEATASAAARGRRPTLTAIHGTTWPAGSNDRTTRSVAARR